MKLINEKYTLLSKIIHFVLSKDFISGNELMNEFDITEDNTITLLNILWVYSIITNPGDEVIIDNNYKVATDLSQIDSDAIDKFIRPFYPIEEIDKLINGLPRDEKNEVSEILNVDKKLISIEEYLPEVGIGVVVRITNRDVVFDETKTDIRYIEDLRVASWNGSDFIITGPYPLYDFTELTNGPDLTSGTLVTHWRSISEEELHAWKHRFDTTNKYDLLELRVDDENEKGVYKALVLAGNLIDRECMKFNKNEDVRIKLEQSYSRIIDLQNSMIRGIIHNIINKDKE